MTSSPKYALRPHLRPPSDSADHRAKDLVVASSVFAGSRRGCCVPRRPTQSTRPCWSSFSRLLMGYGLAQPLLPRQPCVVMGWDVGCGGLNRARRAGSRHRAALSGPRHPIIHGGALAADRGPRRMGVASGRPRSDAGHRSELGRWQQRQEGHHSGALRRRLPPLRRCPAPFAAAGLSLVGRLNEGPDPPCWLKDDPSVPHLKRMASETWDRRPLAARPRCDAGTMASTAGQSGRTWAAQ